VALELQQLQQNTHTHTHTRTQYHDLIFNIYKINLYMNSFLGAFIFWGNITWVTVKM